MWYDCGMAIRLDDDLDARQDAGRVEVDRRALADLLDLATRAAHTLGVSDAMLAAALHGSVAEVQIELSVSA